jgi:hypothetical protein
MVQKDPLQKFYKITIYSSNVNPGGTWYDGSYFIDFPEFLDGDRWQLAVESFNTTGSSANTGYTIHCPQLAQGNTYSTLSQSTSTTIFANNGYSFNRFMDFGCMGLPVRDMSFMRGQNLRFYFSTLGGVPLSTLGASTANSYFGNGVTSWIMTLAIYPIPPM